MSAKGTKASAAESVDLIVGQIRVASCQTEMLQALLLAKVQDASAAGASTVTISTDAVEGVAVTLTQIVKGLDLAWTGLTDLDLRRA